MTQLSQALKLPRGTMCQELGKYDCNDEAFRVTLGGQEAENMLLYQPLEQAPLTAPIAVDRITLRACTTRVDLDQAKPKEAVLLAPFRAGKDGQPNARWMKATSTRIYESILGRSPTPGETGALTAAYGEVAKASGPKAARDWTALSCFAVASSLENIFY